ncbi:MAG: beta-galactosidase [Verrucomicrobiia bacterium]
MKPHSTWMMTAILGFATVASAQMIDTSETRVQTTLEPKLKRIGTIKPRCVGEITGQNWSIGCETIDRDFTNWDSYKDYLVPLGIKLIRLQGGWAKTERDQGKYDWRWLDIIINDARSRGLDILLQTNYGNPIYPGGGSRHLSGGFPTSEEALAAWDKWVEAMATRYKDKVRDWEMWNEPNNNKAHTPELTADFNIRTAEIIKRVIPEARIAGGVLNSPNAEYSEGWLKRVTSRQKQSLFTWFIYHAYTFNPDEKHYEAVEKLKGLFKQYAPTIKLWQGEAGTQSEFCLGGALCKRPWTELTQAKWQTRRMLGDLGHDVESLVFSMADLDYNRWDGYRLGDMDRYGLVKTDKQYRLLKVKIAYYAVQNLVAIFDDTLQRVPDYPCEVQCEKATACYAYKNKKNGQQMLVFWDKSAVPSDKNDTVSATFTIAKGSFSEPVWVDLITGGIHTIPAKQIVRDGDKVIFKDIPVYDAPVLITEKSLVMK